MTIPAEREDRQSLEQLSDAEVVRRVCAGESALYELIMRRHNQRLFRLARSIMDNHADAEEVVQEAYVSAYFKLKQFRGPHGFASWLYRIAMNEALMRRRAHKRAHLNVVRVYDTAESGAQEPAGEMDRELSPGNPESDLYGLQLQRLLERAVDGLPDVYRATFVLREIERLSTAETAQALSIEEVTVKTRVHRARRLLQQQLTTELQAALGGIYRFGGERCDRIIAGVFSRLGC